MPFIRRSAAALFLAAAPAANANIAFSFADPSPGTQLTNVANGGGAGIGALSFDTSAVLDFIIDGTDEGLGTVHFTNARMELAFVVGAASTNAGVTTAPVSGTFTIYDFTGNVRTDILTGSSLNGAFARVQNANSILLSTPDGFVYTAGPALSALLGPDRQLAPLEEAVFTVTDVHTAGNVAFIDSNGSFLSFDANASFSGNSTMVPSPGAGALLAVIAGSARRRRRA